MNCEFIAPEPLRPAQTGWRSGKRIALTIFVVFLTLLLSASAIARNKHSVATAAPDRGYPSALASANRFLQAWQNQDRETGLLMLTDNAKQGSSEDRLEAFFSSGSDAAYEIARGKRLKAGRYAFPVTLFPSHFDAAKPSPAQKTEIVVVRDGRDDWAIDKLP